MFEAISLTFPEQINSVAKRVKDGGIGRETEDKADAIIKGQCLSKPTLFF